MTGRKTVRKISPVMRESREAGSFFSEAPRRRGGGGGGRRGKLDDYSEHVIRYVVKRHARRNSDTLRDAEFGNGVVGARPFYPSRINISGAAA